MNALFAASIGALLLQAPPPETLRVGLDPRSEPSAFVPGVNYSYDETRKPPAMAEQALGLLEGFEIDVMNALGRRLGVTPRVVPTSWFDLEKNLLEGRFDVILGSWTPSERTSKEIVASIPYYDWGLVVAVRSDDARVRTLADLAGLKIGHIPDPAVEGALRELDRGLGVRAVLVRDNGSLLFDDLKAGLIDALIFDSPYVRWRVSRDRSFRVVGEPLNRLGYHVGVRRADAALLARLNAAIQAFRDSDESREIRKKWGSAP